MTTTSTCRLPTSQSGILGHYLQLRPRVNFSINLRNVLEVNEVAETVSVETTVRMFWYDSRVELLNGSLPPPSGGACSTWSPQVEVTARTTT